MPRFAGADSPLRCLQAVCILALLGLLALAAPAADARQLKQAALTDADILNFALNLEVSVVPQRCFPVAQCIRKSAHLGCVAR